jgi:hypothetical protein
LCDQENELSGISRRSLFAFMAGGVSLYWLALRGGFPLAAVDRKRNVALLKTKGGNLVAATEASIRGLAVHQTSVCKQTALSSVPWLPPFLERMACT